MTETEKSQRSAARAEGWASASACRAKVGAERAGAAVHDEHSLGSTVGTPD